MRCLVVGLLLFFAGSALASDSPEEGWLCLFDGKSLEGWKAGEHADAFSVEDGVIKASSGRSHLYYVGPVQSHDFVNFEFKADVMTRPGANSGVYIHTEYQGPGWPAKGYEVQINNSHSDPKRTAGLYAVKDVYDAPAKDNEWFTLSIVVKGKHIVTKVNGKVIVDYTEGANPKREEQYKGRLLSHGTFALQGHDPGSTTYFRNIYVKPLP